MLRLGRGVTGKHYAAQGNILVGKETVEAIARAYEETDGDLATRLLSAPDAGQEVAGTCGKAVGGVARRAGGWGLRRGQRQGSGSTHGDRPEPIRELLRIRDLHTLYFGETAPDDVIAVDGDVSAEVADVLLRAGYLEGTDAEDEVLFDALSAYIRAENFEEREQRRGYVDRAVLEYLKGQRSPGGLARALPLL